MAKENTAAQIAERFEAEMPPRLGRLCHRLWTDVAQLHLAWKSFLVLYAESDETVKLLNRCAGTFFTRLKWILLDDIILRITRLVDPARDARGRENASFPLVVKRLRDADYPAVADALESKVKGLIEKAKVVRLRRNRRVAHADLEAVLRIGEQVSPGVTIRMIRELLANVSDCVHVFEKPFMNSATSFEYSTEAGSASRLVYWLGQGLEHREQEKQKWKKRKSALVGDSR